MPTTCVRVPACACVSILMSRVVAVVVDNVDNDFVVDVVVVVVVVVGIVAIAVVTGHDISRLGQEAF